MTAFVKKIFRIDFFISNILIPAIALTSYCYLFNFFSLYFVFGGIDSESGVSSIFAGRLGRLMLLVTAGIVITFFVLLTFMRKDHEVFSGLGEQFYYEDLLLLLLPLTPILQYIVNNQEILSPTGTLYILFLSLFFSGILVTVIPFLLHKIVSVKTLMLLGLAFAFTITSMASLSASFTWFQKGSLKIQILFLGGTFVAAWLLYNFGKRRLLYIFIVSNIVINTIAQLSPQTSQTVNISPLWKDNKLLRAINNKEPVLTSNIYLMVYDAYVANETMLGYGIDNNPQEDYLTNLGFKLYPHTYSIGWRTLETMSKVLNASTEYYGDTRMAVSGDGIVQGILKSQGYQTYGLFPTDYMFRDYSQNYSYSLPASVIPSHIQLLKAIFLGEFRFDIGELGFVQQTREQFLAKKRSILMSLPDDHVFVYMHSNRPSHSQISGACLPNEIDLYKDRLAIANLEMQQDINILIDLNPDAIIVVAGDHGPGLTKNCWLTTGSYDISEISRQDIQDRYGTFLAIRWPGGNFEEYDDIKILQDLFPSIFAYLYQDTTILNTKIEPMISTPNSNSDISVNNGVIVGGMDDGEPLFLFPLVPQE